MRTRSIHPYIQGLVNAFLAVFLLENVMAMVNKMMNGTRKKRKLEQHLTGEGSESLEKEEKNKPNRKTPINRNQKKKKRSKELTP